MARLADAVRGTAAMRTDLLFAIDDDDPASIEQSAALGSRVLSVTGPRRSMGAWTNNVASLMTGAYRAFASLGDDHLPRTDGWDSVLLAAIGDMGGTGIAYGDDLIMGEGVPTAPVISSDVVAALGWMCHPAMSHFCVDNVWADLGRGAGCLAYRPDVVVEHLHVTAGKSPPDATYADAGTFNLAHPDWLAYQEWRDRRMAADVAAVRALLPASATSGP
jgi:hypothetical protein